jgi:hypothetical protein
MRNTNDHITKRLTADTPIKKYVGRYLGGH